MTTSKPRVRAYVDHDTYAKLQFATRRPHVTISATVNDALKVYLSDEYRVEHDNAVLRRLDQMTRQMELTKQKAGVHSEAFALFARIFFQISPPIPEGEQEAAHARGVKRFDFYTSHLREILYHTSKHLFGMMDDVYLDESAFFTEAELEALRQVAADEASHGTGQEEWPEDAEGA